MSKPNSIPVAESWVNNLPRLTDEAREALEGGYIAMQGVPVGNEPTDQTELVQVLDDLSDGICELCVARDALREYIELMEADRASPTLQIIRDALFEWTRKCEDLCDQARELVRA